MNRRDFLKSSVACLAAAAVPPFVETDGWHHFTASFDLATSGDSTARAIFYRYGGKTLVIPIDGWGGFTDIARGAGVVIRERPAIPVFAQTATSPDP